MSTKAPSATVRRAYGLFKERVVHNVQWSVDALDSLIAGDEAKLKHALKLHTNVNLDDGLKLVVDYEPELGETVEHYTEKVTTVLLPPKHSKLFNSPGDDEEPADLFMRKSSKPKEWKSKSFTIPSQKKPPAVWEKALVQEWREMVVCAVSVGKARFALKDPLDDNVTSNVPRGKIRPLGREVALFEEPHFVFGSKKKKDKPVPVAKYFKSMRLNDEGTDGGGVYGRHVILPTYDPNKMVATEGDTMIHTLLKNRCIKNRKEILDLLMALDSFTELTLTLPNGANRSCMEEMDPPFYFRIPLASYSYNFSVRLREMKAGLAEQASAALEPTGLKELAHDITGQAEDHDAALRQWSQRSNVEWKHTGGNGLTEKSLEASRKLANQAKEEDANEWKKFLPAAATSSSSGVGTKNGDKSKKLLEDPLGRGEGQKRAAKATAAMAAKAAATTSAMATTTVDTSGVFVDFTDEGAWRGSVVGHRVAVPRPSWWRRGMGEGKAGEVLEQQAEIEALVSRLQFGVEWKKSMQPSNKLKSKYEEAFFSDPALSSDADNASYSRRRQSLASVALEAREEAVLKDNSDNYTSTSTERSIGHKKAVTQSKKQAREAREKVHELKTERKRIVAEALERHQRNTHKASGAKKKLSSSPSLGELVEVPSATRRRWYLGSAFMEQHPLTVQNYIGAIGLERMDPLPQTSLDDVTPLLAFHDDGESGGGLDNSSKNNNSSSKGDATKASSSSSSSSSSSKSSSLKQPQQPSISQATSSLVGAANRLHLKKQKALEGKAKAVMNAVSSSRGGASSELSAKAVVVLGPVSLTNMRALHEKLGIKFNSNTSISSSGSSGSSAANGNYSAGAATVAEARSNATVTSSGSETDYSRHWGGKAGDGDDDYDESQVTRSVNVARDGFVLRPFNEKAFLDDWQYEVFTPECLTDISTNVGASVSKGATAEKSKGDARAWFLSELNDLRAELKKRKEQAHKAAQAVGECESLSLGDNASGLGLGLGLVDGGGGSYGFDGLGVSETSGGGGGCCSAEFSSGGGGGGGGGSGGGGGGGRAHKRGKDKGDLDLDLWALADE